MLYVPRSLGCNLPTSNPKPWQDIASLLSLSAEALKALSKPTTDEQAPEAHTAAFKSAMDAFLATLHSVDVRLKRQILGLEEGGIISLKDSKLGGGGGSTASLEPNGVGEIGKLDVGWLNSRSSAVDRLMEATLWTRAREFLEGKLDDGESSMET